MAQRTTNSAESWENIYTAFENVSFVSYDFDSIKNALIDYTKRYYAEIYNDFIVSAEFIAMLEMFAMIAEQLAYRVDMVAHENFITTAQRKQSILRLAKLISYKASRNIPVRGLVKINTISTSERVLDSRGIDLSGLTITWNDPNNSNWKEQFLLVMNRILNTRFGQPQKTFQIGDVVMDLYSLKNNPSTLKNGVVPFNVSTGLDDFPMEVVPADIDENGPFEREPDTMSTMSIIFANDGIGDGSDYSGFLCYIKQGVLTNIVYDIGERLPDRRLDFTPINVNQTDVWVQQIDEAGRVQSRWSQVETISEQNLVFNSNRSTRKKFEVDTRENDTITVIFGDGDFSDAPQGLFRFWMRQSANRSLVIQKNKVVGEIMNFDYVSVQGSTESTTMSFSLTSTLQNGSGTETIEHIRKSAPSTYYSQNRMVNGQDYNTYMLKDPSILRLKTINRTFAGQPKYIDWNDASGSYENVKLFGDDAILKYEISIDSLTVSESGQTLIDSVIEPLLSTSGVINTLLHISASDPMMRGVISSPRRKFIEDNRGDIYFSKNGMLLQNNGSLKEKTEIQGLIDRHWYGEPIEYVQDVKGNMLAKILDPTQNPKDDSKIYSPNIPRTIDGINKYPPGDIGSGLQPIASQEYFGLRYNRYFKGIGNASISINGTPPGSVDGEVWTIEILADKSSIAVRSSIRGTFPNGIIGEPYEIHPSGFQEKINFFTVTQNVGTKLEPGDAFILDMISQQINVRKFSNFENNLVNLNGYWQVIPQSVMSDYSEGINDEDIHALKFTASDDPDILQHSWVIFIKKIHQQPTNNIIGYEIHTRDLKLVIESPTTKFWHNSVEQLLDNETKKRVFDNIKILRSNLDSTRTDIYPFGKPLSKNQVYDVVGPIKNRDGRTDFHKLEIIPTDLLQEDDSGNLMPDRILQFENFSEGSYEYFLLANPTVKIPAPMVTFTAGSFMDTTGVFGRRQRMPRTSDGVNSTAGLDFMWQHFSPFTNIIDPSVTNIHDAYLMTRGYYDNVISYVRGISKIAPFPPSPLELKNSYGYLLDNKMMSDTIVLHPGKIRLLFGSLAEPQLRAKFKVVSSGTGTLTNEQIKEEILNVINSYFDIDGWDFGETFYATKLIALIHQRLPVDVASVVLVPIYSSNSFGSLFTVEAGFDEILQSAAKLTDIDIVESLTPSVIRQSK